MPQDEFERIRHLTELFALRSDAVQLGIGDDAAVLRAQPHPTVAFGFPEKLKSTVPTASAQPQSDNPLRAP